MVKIKIKRMMHSDNNHDESDDEANKIMIMLIIN